MVSARVLRGFVDCLALDEVDASFDSSITEKEGVSVPQIRAQTASVILELLISDVKRSAGLASLSNYLTGFDMRRPNETKLENPGVSGAPRTCLHAVLDIADASLGQDLETLSFGALVEPAYRLLFWLSALPNTGASTLRYLRTEYDFIHRHIKKLKLPDDRQGDLEAKSKEAAFAVREISGWLLKLCSLELAAVAESQPSYVTALSKLLLAIDSDEPQLISDIVGTGLSTPRTGRRRVGRERKVQRGRRLFEFLASLKSLAARNPDEAAGVPRLQHFEGIRLSKVVAACTVKTAKGFYKCDVSRLYDVLEQELVALQGNGVVSQIHLVRSVSNIFAIEGGIG